MMTYNFFYSSPCALKLRYKFNFFCSSSLILLDIYICCSLVLSTWDKFIFFISSIFWMSISFSCLISLNFLIIWVKSRLSCLFYLFFLFPLKSFDFTKAGNTLSSFYTFVRNIFKLGRLLCPLITLDYWQYFYL